MRSPPAGRKGPARHAGRPSRAPGWRAEVMPPRNTCPAAVIPCRLVAVGRGTEAGSCGSVAADAASSTRRPGAAESHRPTSTMVNRRRRASRPEPPDGLRMFAYALAFGAGVRHVRPKRSSTTTRTKSDDSIACRQADARWLRRPRSLRRASAIAFNSNGGALGPRYLTSECVVSATEQGISPLARI